MTKRLAPVPPGEILMEEFLRPLSVSQNKLARDVDIPVSRVSDIVNGKRAITADTALRLAQYLGTSAEMWMNLQSDYDLRVARAARGEAIRNSVRQRAA